MTERDNEKWKMRREQGAETKAARASCLGNEALGSWMEIGQDVSIVVGPGMVLLRGDIRKKKLTNINSTLIYIYIHWPPLRPSLHAL